MKQIKKKRNKEDQKSTKKEISTTKKIIIFIISFMITECLGCAFLLYGPLPKFRNWLVTTAMTTMNHQYLATLFYSDETIQKILEENKIIEPDSNTNLDIINTNSIKTTVYKDEYEKEILEHDAKDAYKMIEVSGKNYSGYLVAIYDPSKVKVVTSKYLGTNGEYLIDMAKREDALVAINGGGFLDADGLGTGAEVEGIVIQDGKILNSSRYTRSGGLIGFTKDNKLYLGRVSAQEAIELGIRDAVEFGPFLIVNGESSKVVGNGGYGLHPRTAIAQRKDGVVLFLVIDGRRIGCMGADMDDLIEILMRYGAYNAANLDGGNSSALIIKNKLINHPINWDEKEETRPIATGFILTK
ncbi:MAG: phosphodiester glycosidase family protein [Erysipelotrichaceae bacterium]|nr:phosphodiester glycosidase family protein [Erysipelotrichaceae bacterium]